MELGIDISKGCIEYDDDVRAREGEAVGVEFEGYGGVWGGVVVWRLGEVAKGVSTRS